MGKFKLINGDCIEEMKGIPNGSVDLVLVDPPYGVTACKWDSIIPLEPMWEQITRILKPNRAVVMTGLQPFTSKLICSNLKMFKYSQVWVKNSQSGFAQAKNKPMSKHEDILVFSEGGTGHKSQCKNRMTYNPQGLKPFNKVIKNSNNDRPSSFERRKNAKKEYLQEFTNYPTSVLHFDCDRDGLHPTQKPLSLLEYLVLTYSNKDETVLDFTMGSGTTGVACLNTSRKFIGIELDENYFKIAKNRIHQRDLELWGSK